MTKSYRAKQEENERGCYVIDAKDKTLGKVATKAASILRGKHKPTFTPHIDCGDTVIIINADKFKVTGRKMTDKIYERYTGFPSGKRYVALGDMLTKRPTEPMRLAVTRMIPSGPLGNKIRTRLRLYTEDTHPHQAQKPILISI